MTPEYGELGSWRGPNTLKYRIDTVSSPYSWVNIRQYCSPTTFCSAYGDNGSEIMSSRLGRVAALPYAEEDPAKTRRLTCASRAATSTFKVPVTLARFEPSGSFTERGTDGIAAWCS